MPFYQEVLDRLMKEFPQKPNPSLIILKRLCIAVDNASKDEKRREKVDPLVLELVKEGRSDVNPVRSLSDDFFIELLSRVLFLQLIRSFQRLRSWRMVKLKKERPFLYREDWRISIDIWDEIVKKALAGKLSNESALTKAWRIRFRTMEGLLIDLREHLSVPLKPALQIVVDGELYKLIKKVLWGMQAVIQEILEHSILDLENRGNGAKLKRLEKLVQDQRDLFITFRDTNILNRGFIINRTKEKKLEYVDAILPERVAGRRRMKYIYYDLEGADQSEEREVVLHSILLNREKQIGLLMDLHGAERKQKSKRPTSKAKQKIKTLELTVEAKWRRDIVKSRLNGKLLLRSDDDWVGYLVAAFQHIKEHIEAENARKNTTFQNKEQRRAAKNAAKNAAWEAIMKDLERYLQAFTGFATHNLRETGPSYLTMRFNEFPRNMTGQLLHDCGVYAVRLAYILSLVGQRIDAGESRDNRVNLCLMFLRLPNHVGLIIRGENIKTYITHNAYFDSLTVKEIRDNEEQWKQHDELGGTRTTPATTLDENQFLAELAAPFFMDSINLPYALLPVPAPGRDAAVTRALIWNAYRQNVFGQPGLLFSNKIAQPGAMYQFNMNYIEIQEQVTTWKNKFIVGLWNGHWFETWQLRGERLNNAFQALGKTRPVPKSKKRDKELFESERDQYILQLKKPVEEIQKAKDLINDLKFNLDSTLEDNQKEVLRLGIRNTWALRLALNRNTLERFDEYLMKISGPVDQIMKFDPPPFATLKDWLVPAPE